MAKRKTTTKPKQVTKKDLEDFKTDTKKVLKDGVDGLLKKHQKEIKDYQKALIQNEIDIKGYKDKIAELSKTINQLNKEIQKLDSNKHYEILGNFFTMAEAEIMLNELNKIKRPAKIKSLGPNHYVVMTEK
tara:strand:+ start:338 stop:730 length:393 start_codon:yes stop_codon:yes gene_type:complete